MAIASAATLRTGGFSSFSAAPARREKLSVTAVDEISPPTIPASAGPARRQEGMSMRFRPFVVPLAGQRITGARSKSGRC